MTIDVEGALAARFAAVPTPWTTDEVILYHLAVGAGSEDATGRELPLLWEDQLVVMPTFAVVPGSLAAEAATRSVAGLVDPAMMLQGAHEITIHQPLPIAARTRSTAWVERVEDTGKAAVFTVVSTTHDDRQTLLATNRFTLLVRGAGGFGGPRPEPPGDRTVGEPTGRLRCATRAHQGALYRLVGARTPLHIDPATARDAGFAAPPLAGVCTLGTVARCIVEHEFDHDHGAIGRVAARFVGPVYPGETLSVRLWPTPAGVGFEALVEERSAVALTMGAVDLR